MTIQYSVAERTAEFATLNTNIGINAQVFVYSGAVPATVATAPTGTLLIQYIGNATAFGVSAAGVLTANAIANVNATAAGTAGYYRINTSAGVAVAQGTVFPQVVIATNALTAANGNVLNFAATTGVVVGMNVTGVGIPASTTVVAVTGATVVISTTSTAGVASAASITFNGDFTIGNTNVAPGQPCSFTSLTLTRGGA
jgi:hypothetical protein